MLLLVWFIHNPVRALRSSNELVLEVPRSRLKTKGDRAFSVAAPKLWNSLPLRIRHAASLESLKSSLKTNFFSLAFGPFGPAVSQTWSFLLIPVLFYVWWVLHTVLIFFNYFYSYILYFFCFYGTFINICEKHFDILVWLFKCAIKINVTLVKLFGWPDFTWFQDLSITNCFLDHPFTKNTHRK